MNLRRTLVAVLGLTACFLGSPAYGMPADPPVSIPDATTLVLLGSACVIGYVVLRKQGKRKRGKK